MTSVTVAITIQSDNNSFCPLFKPTESKQISSNDMADIRTPTLSSIRNKPAFFQLTSSMIQNINIAGIEKISVKIIANKIVEGQKLNSNEKYNITIPDKTAFINAVNTQMVKLKDID